jgi:hypothetical protein
MTLAYAHEKLSAAHSVSAADPGNITERLDAFSFTASGLLTRSEMFPERCATHVVPGSAVRAATKYASGRDSNRGIDLREG